MQTKSSLFIDVHSHLDHPMLLNKIDEIIRNAQDAGLKYIITNGINPKTNRFSLELAKKYPMIRVGLGLYPRAALKKETETIEFPAKINEYDADEEIDFIRKSKNNVAAISEVGLDFVDGESEEQIKDFQKILELAEEIKKPIVVHSRKAEQKCIEMIESTKLKKVVMHCFSGKKSLVRKIADNGWFLTIPTIVTRSQQFQEIAKNVDISQLFCETDSPYLGPFKDKWNEPAFVVESYKKVAEIKGMDLAEVANNIFMNWQKVFE